MPRADLRAAAVGAPFARYRYDPAQAQQELASAGWHRGADGRIVNAASEVVELPLRSTSASDAERQIVAQAWRDLGLAVAEEPIPGSLVSDRAYRASFPGMEITAQSNGDQILPRFDGRQCPRPPRWVGTQGGCYQNPELDRLIDKLYGTLDLKEQGLVLRDIGTVIADDVAMLPLYFSITQAAVRSEVHALDDFTGAPMGSPGQISRNAHLWDRN